MMPAIDKTFDFMGDDLVELSKENETFKKQIGDYDGKWLAESKAKLLKQIDDEKRASLIMCKCKKDEKTLDKWHILNTSNCGKKNSTTSSLQKIKYKT